MSWKLAELKWRQDLGLYESRWDIETGELPLRRKNAIQAFNERQMVPSVHRTSASMHDVPMEAPQQPFANLGRQFLQPCDRSLAYTRTPPALSLSCDDNTPLLQPLLKQKHISSPSVVASVCGQDKGLQQKWRRSQSCSDLTKSSTRLSIIRPATPPSHRRWKNRSSYSPVDIIKTEEPQTLQSREELTRLLDHIDSPGNSTSASRGKSFSSSRERDVDENQPLLLVQQAVADPFEVPTNHRLKIGNGTFRLLDNRDCPNPHDLASTSGASRTTLPSTPSEHNSSSTLLPKDSMPPFIPTPDPENDREGNAPSSRTGSSVRRSPGPIRRRRTTPIYQEFGQAYSSITGGVTSPSLTSPIPGTDSLNNVYSRAMADSSASNRNEQHISSSGAAQTQAAVPIEPTVARAMQRPTVTFPFQREGSLDSDEYMTAGDDLDNNPAGLQLGSNDVPLRHYPILRNVQRRSATPQSSPVPLPSAAAYESAEAFDEHRPSVTFQPGESPFLARANETSHRSRTPYPPAREAYTEDQYDDEEEEEADSTVGAIVEQYRNGDLPAMPVPVHPPTVLPSSVNGQQIGQGFDSQMEPTEDVGGGVIVSPIRTAPDWTLPVAPPSALTAAVHQNGIHPSSSPPTYGSTQALLNRSGANDTSTNDLISPPNGGRSDLEEFPGTEFRNAVDAGSLQAGRLYSVTPTPGDIGLRSPFAIPVVGTPVAEDLLPLARTQFSSALDIGAREPSFVNQHTSSTGNGLVIGNSSLLQVRGAFRNRHSLATSVAYNEEEDTAWETTQGTNTQRNSAVPESGYLTFSSSSGAEPVSLWDPVSTRGRQVQELELEFNQLRQANEGQEGEAAQGGSAQGSEETSSLPAFDQATTESAQVSPILSPTTLTTHDLGSHMQSSSSQAVDLPHLAPGPALRVRLNRMTPSETLVEMSSDTAPDSGSRNGNGNAIGSMNSVTSSLRRYNRGERVVVSWRENTREQTLRSVQSDIARYDRPERPMRHFPGARLTTDRRVLEAERDPVFVRRQRFLTFNLMAAALVFYPFGGFVLISSMAENGQQARQALLELSVRGGGQPVNNINEADVALAERLQVWAVFGWVGVLVALVAVLAVCLL